MQLGQAPGGLRPIKRAQSQLREPGLGGRKPVGSSPYKKYMGRTTYIDGIVNTKGRNNRTISSKSREFKYGSTPDIDRPIWKPVGKISNYIF